MTLKEGLIPFHSLDIILVCGLHGSGKSWFSKAHFSQTARLRVNRAEIRRMLYEMTHFGEVWKNENFQENTESLVKHTEKKLIEQLLQTGHPVLIDNTSVTVESRSKYIELARAQHKTIGAIYLQCSIQKCMERNRQKPDGVPEMVISRLAVSARQPQKSEGFAHVMIVPNETGD